MRIVKGRPPNFVKILEVFPAATGENVIFSYGDVIYSPSGGQLSDALMKHEAVHGSRQLIMGVEAWWDRYLWDENFRYIEELLAHRAEYQAMIGEGSTRHERRSALKAVSKRLSSALYGKCVTQAQAKKDILDDEEE